MRRIILFTLLVSMGVVLTAAIDISPGGCLPTVAVTSGYSEYFRVGDQTSYELEISFEPDATGSETVAVLGLEFCSRETTSACNPYNFDTNADGLGDTNLLDASTIEKSGLKGISGFRFLRVYASTNPSGTDEPEFTICRRKD